MEGVLAILFLVFISCFIYNICSKNVYNKIISCVCVIICSTIFTVVLVDYTYECNPTALDVYNNKTTLQITYEDSIPVDTIVVFKEEFKK